jgi:hypothetical protein
MYIRFIDITFYYKIVFHLQKKNNNELLETKMKCLPLVNN